MRGLAVAAGIFAAIAGAVWALTSAYPAGCTLTGQLEGQACYPALVNIHNIAGPVALVLAVATGVFVIAAVGGRRPPAQAYPQPGYQPPPQSLPPCMRCGYPASAHPGGRCPVPPGNSGGYGITPSG
jgi:hypothetical protein